MKNIHYSIISTLPLRILKQIFFSRLNTYIFERKHVKGCIQLRQVRDRVMSCRGF